jgi:hypothetical protein
MTTTTIYHPAESTYYDVRIDQLDRLADIMDSQFSIPGTSIRFGWDTIIGLIPGIGDTITSLVSAYIIREAKQMRVPNHVLWLMGFNIFLDWIIGSIPILGDILDIGWKANRRNITLIRKHARFLSGRNGQV